MKTVLFLLACVSISHAAEIFLFQHSAGRYRFTYSQARKCCEALGASLATKAELEDARKAGYSECSCGWTMDRTAHFPMTTSVEGCGSNAQLHTCDWSDKWNAYCYRGDPIGNCTKPLGMEDHGIGGSQLAASSENKYWWPIFSPSRWTAQLARLHNYEWVNAWMPAINGRHQWIQADLEIPTAITGIITQGAKRLGKKYWVSSFVVAYSKDGHNFKNVKENEETKIFKGNSDNNGLVRNMFPEPILSRYIRIYPYHWNVNIALRFELLGCDMETYKLAEALSRDLSVENISPSFVDTGPSVFIEREPEDA